MATSKSNNIKLGIFVIAGLIVVVFGLYLIGKDTNMFSKNYTLRVRFPNVQGLTAGNNVRYSGIQVGTVDKVTILNDTLIEVTMLIDQKMKSFIHRDDKVSLGTDGVMGNKLLNITPSKDKSPLAQENDILVPNILIGTEEMLETLGKTNTNLAEISEELKSTIKRINTSSALWQLLNDSSLPANLRKSFSNISHATEEANKTIADLHTIVNDVKAGKGPAGLMLRDTAFTKRLEDAVSGINLLEEKARDLANQLNTLAASITNDINTGKGVANALMKDSVIVQKLYITLDNLEDGTESFSENMEALKHNFLFKGYFKKLEKQQQEEAAEKQKNQ
jgi:phospholipid/cholesterol/gamma-HCH transport system substrate-binding protein